MGWVRAHRPEAERQWQVSIGPTSRGSELGRNGLWGCAMGPYGRNRRGGGVQREVRWGLGRRAHGSPQHLKLWSSLPRAATRRSNSGLLTISTCSARWGCAF